MKKLYKFNFVIQFVLVMTLVIKKISKSNKL